jgi:plastocyanin
MRKELIILIVLFSVFLAMGCVSNTGNDTQKPATPPETPATPPETPAVPASGKTVEITIQSFAFNSDSVTISPGDAVRWTNMDSAAHTVIGNDFSSGNLNKGESYEHIFAKAGTYDYHCSIHPSMKGAVIVK